jgi:O-antigen/teichoic acid export membrane protein
VPVGILTFAGPLVMIPFTRHLAAFIGIFVFGRLAGAVVQFMMCVHLFPELRDAAYDRSCVRGLLARGGWMTISSVISGVMVYLDRFAIGAYVSLTAVAYYTTPQEIISRAWVLPAALVATLFPAFSVERGAQNGRAALLFERGIRYLFIVLFPCMLIIVIWAPELLRLWLGNEFAEHAATPLRWFAGGVLVNSLAQVAFAQVQGAGRPDITAKLHMLELPFYVGGVFWAVRAAGINGAAIVWFFRVALDMVGLFLASSRLLHEGWAVTMRLIAMVTIGLAALLASVLLPPHFKLPATLIALLVFTLIAWTVVLANSDRAAVRQALKQTSM